MRIQNLIAVCLVGIAIFTFGSSTAYAQDAGADNPSCQVARTYTSWLDSLESLSGTLSLAGSENGRDVEIDGEFAIVVGEDARSTNYFVQIANREQRGNGVNALDFAVGLVHEDLVAVLESYRTVWEVSRREDFRESRDLEGAFLQADSFLKAAFQQLQLLSLSDCLETEIIADRDAVHYHLNIPPFMGSMLISQLTGEPLGDELTLETTTVDYWFDEQADFISKIHIKFAATDNRRGTTIQADAVLELTSVNNIGLKVPQYIRILAMQQGIIEPDFVAEFIVTE